ncbi:MAG: squalene--hopene cyclase [Planctomycetia bacterium]|nr:squalene--hopene cyclase [Planctomycetia bacterium]
MSESVQRSLATFLCLVALLAAPAWACAEGAWETTPESEAALQRGLQWLARNQGPKGTWDDKHLGLVSMGALAFMAAGHMPGRSSEFGEPVEKALNAIVSGAQPSGLINVAQGDDMYNHGLSTFVLGQAYGMSGDPRIGRALDRALRLICDSQCADGGWGYQAKSLANGHDLSLVVMQSKALRSAMDCGLKVPPEVVGKAVASVRRYYIPEGGYKPGETEADWKKRPGFFSYQVADKGRVSIAMTSCGVVCLQEFGQYDDWRIPQAMQYVRKQILGGAHEFDQQYAKARKSKPANHVPFDGYTLYYVGQALYQVGGKDWRELYPVLRDQLVKSQTKDPNNPSQDGSWQSTVWWMQGKEAQLYGTAIACFYLSIPNRYLPILQEGRIEGIEGARLKNDQSPNSNLQ